MIYCLGALLKSCAYRVKTWVEIVIASPLSLWLPTGNHFHLCMLQYATKMEVPLINVTVLATYLLVLKVSKKSTWYITYVLPSLFLSVPTKCRSKWRSGWPRATWSPKWTLPRIPVAVCATKSWRTWFLLWQSLVSLCSRHFHPQFIDSLLLLSQDEVDKEQSMLWIASQSISEEDKHVYTYRKGN